MEPDNTALFTGQYTTIKKTKPCLDIKQVETKEGLGEQQYDSAWATAWSIVTTHYEPRIARFTNDRYPKQCH